MTKEILFASRKGATGKSTLCAMVANHLASNGMKVAVIDCDNCDTLTWRRKADMKALPEGAHPPYPIFRDEDCIDKEHLFEGYDYVLIDNDDLVRGNGKGAVVVPFIYTEMVLDSTFRFVRDMRRSENSEVLFVPNEVHGYKLSVKKRDIMENVNWILGIFGKILPKVSNSRLMDQVSTIANTVEMNLLVKDFIDALLPECKMTEEELTAGEDSRAQETPEGAAQAMDLFPAMDEQSAE